MRRLLRLLDSADAEQAVRNLLNEVGELAGRVGYEFDASTHEAAIVTLFDRERSTFGAVGVLLDNEFADEAVMLGRPLFTESLVRGDRTLCRRGRCPYPALEARREGARPRSRAWRQYLCVGGPGGTALSSRR
jgi:hypothetical protein